MKPAEYPAPIRQLIGELRKFPGIGPRSAERIALWMIRIPQPRTAEITAAITAVSDRIRPCSRCGFFAEADLCEICADDSRNPGILCVVEHATDILPIEKAGVFRGRYHALGGRISPLDHVGAEDIRIGELLRRAQTESPEEIILALSADVEGEATARYIAGLLAGTGTKVTRIAQGLPAGGGLESADELTLARAMTGRSPLSPED